MQSVDSLCPPRGAIAGCDSTQRQCLCSNMVGLTGARSLLHLSATRDRSPLYDFTRLSRSGPMAQFSFRKPSQRKTHFVHVCSTLLICRILLTYCPYCFSLQILEDLRRVQGFDVSKAEMLCQPIGPRRCPGISFCRACGTLLIWPPLSGLS
jgi:hypothetical protein